MSRANQKGSLSQVYMNLVLLSLLILLLDAPYLMLSGKIHQERIRAIQGGRAIRFRPAGAIVVYPALAYLVSRCKTRGEAFMMGLTVYAVYDFTLLTLFHDYTLGVAVMDTLWGGILFTLAFLVQKILG